MNQDLLIKKWLQEEEQTFKGWDFSYLDNRWQGEALPWSYGERVKAALKNEYRLLDLGTGGGEFLLTLNHPYARTAVTEGWAPNIALCIKRLAPLGISVYPVQDDGVLPMADNTFDMVINRHESYNLAEVKRVLKPRGLFITQQVGGENCKSLEEKINMAPKKSFDFSLKTEADAFEKHGFCIQWQKEHFSSLKFFDVGAIVFFAKRIPWSFPDFSVTKNIEKLWPLQDEITKNGFVSTMEQRFMIEAVNQK